MYFVLRSGAFLLACATGLTLLSVPALAHEPVFSLGPEVIWKGGKSIETEVDINRGGKDTTALHTRFLYGVTSRLSLEVEAPWTLSQSENGRTSQGLGDVEVRAKYQFFRKNMLGAQQKIAGIFGIKTPTGSSDARPRLGTGTTDFLIGGSYGYESRRWYNFLTVRYRLRTDNGSYSPGDHLDVDPAIGIRPILSGYHQWDAVFLLESNLEIDFSDHLNRRRSSDTGGSAFWIGPTALISPDPQWMFKGGIQWPVWQDLNGDQRDQNFRAIFGIEYHF